MNPIDQSWREDIKTTLHSIMGQVYKVKTDLEANAVVAEKAAPACLAAIINIRNYLAWIELHIDGKLGGPHDNS